MIVIAITTGQFELHEGRQYAGQAPRVIKLTQFYRNAVGNGQLKVLSEDLPQVENQLVEMQAELELKLGQLGGDVQALVQALREEKNPQKAEAPKVEAPKAVAKAAKAPKE